MTTRDDQMVFWTRNGLERPKRTSPIRFAVQRNHGLTSNTWGVKVEKNGEAYVYCRDAMVAQHVSFHQSGRQHISFDMGAPGMGSIAGNRFMNQWRVPSHREIAIPTLKLLFPPWGRCVNADYRARFRQKWNRNHIMIKGDEEMVTVVSFFIIDEELTFRNENRWSPSYPIGVLPLFGLERRCT